MNKKGFKRKIAATILVIFLSAFILSPSIKSQEEEPPLEITLEDALKLALENSRQIELARISIDKAQLFKDVVEFNDKEAKKREEELKSNTLFSQSLGSLPVTTSDFDYQYQVELQKRQADFQLTMAQLSLNYTEKMVRYGLIASYYKALLAQKNYEIKKSSLNRAEEIFRIAGENFKLGVIAKKDLMDADLKLAQAQSELRNAEVEEDKAFVDLKKLINVSYDKRVVLKDELIKPEKEEVESIEPLVSKAMENRMDVVQAKKNMEIAGYDFDMIKKVYPENTFKYKEKELNYKEARIKYEDAKSNAEKEVRKVYLEFLAARDNLKTYEKAVELAKEGYRLSLLNYKEGLIRSVDLAQAEEALKQAQLQEAYGIFQYTIAKLNLENVIYIPLTTSGGN